MRGVSPMFCVPFDLFCSGWDLFPRLCRNAPELTGGSKIAGIRKPDRSADILAGPRPNAATASRSGFKTRRT